MARAVLRSGSVVTASGALDVVLEYRPTSTSRWRSTLVCAYPVLAQPSTVGGGVGAALGTAYLQVDRADVTEFRLAETYYGVAGGAVVALPWGCGPTDGLTFSGASVLRWLLDSTGVGNSVASSAMFCGEEP